MVSTSCNILIIISIKNSNATRWGHYCWKNTKLPFRSMLVTDMNNYYSNCRISINRLFLFLLKNSNTLLNNVKIEWNTPYALLFFEYHEEIIISIKCCLPLSQQTVRPFTPISLQLFRIIWENFTRIAYASLHSLGPYRYILKLSIYIVSISRLLTKKINMYCQYLLTNHVFIENLEISTISIAWGHLTH